jgi:hypothetical protein
MDSAAIHHTVIDRPDGHTVRSFYLDTFFMRKMSYDPIPSGGRLTSDIDINCGSGMFGQTCALISTTLSPIGQNSSYFSKYYHRYVVDISNIIAVGIFNLAPIGSNLIIGHSLIIECLATIPNTNKLEVRAANGTVIAEMLAGDKIFLQAIAATSSWSVTYAVPLGTNNNLLVYTGQYPRVRILPLQKELFANGNVEYGIKSIYSFDTSEPATLSGLPITLLSNAHKIISEGSVNTAISNFSAPTPLSQSIVVSAISSRNSNFILQEGGLITGSIIASTQGKFDQVKYSENMLIAAANNSYINSNFTSALRPLTNSAIIASDTSSITAVNTINTDVNNTIIAGSDTCQIVSATDVAVISSNGIFMRGGIGTTLIANDRTFLQSNGVTTLQEDGSFSNGQAFTTMLSSYNVFLGVSALKYRYCVMGGFNTATWTIDSKTGIYYGSNFINTQPLPGVSELYENLNAGTILELGRLVKFSSGKVTYCANGEIAAMITRPLEGAAFLGGCPIEWPQKYLTDVFGRKIIETVPIGQVIHEVTNDPNLPDEYKASLIKSYASLSTLERPKLNPLYDPTIDYARRTERPEEWTICEKLGRVVLEHDGSLTTPDQYVMSADNGIGKLSLTTTNVRVLKYVNSQYVEVDIIPVP